jgi:hypothetical protein
VKLEQVRPNVFTLTVAGPELSALIAAGRMALDVMEHDPNAPPEVRELLTRVLSDYDAARGRLKEPNGR